jgi:protein AroM
VERDDLLPLLQKKVDEIEQTDVDAVLIPCAGDFSGLVSSLPLIVPYKLFSGVVQWMRPKRHVGIICPLEEQKQAAEKKWREVGLDPVVVTASPFSHADLGKAGYTLQREELDLVILDDYAFGEAAKKELLKLLMCPVLSIRTIVVGILVEFLG